MIEFRVLRQKLPFSTTLHTPESRLTSAEIWLRLSPESNDQENILSRWLRQSIKDFCNESEHNALRDAGNEKAWEEPITGFSRGDDSLYDTLKKDIGAFYWTPLEIYIKTFPKEKEVTSDKLTIISWILPHTEQIKQDQRKQTKYPSERWVRARIFGEQFNDKLRCFMVDILSNRGYHALAPVLSPLWATRPSKLTTKFCRKSII